MSTDRWVDKEDVAYTPTQTHIVEYYLTIKKEWNDICSNMGVPRDYDTKWSEPEKDKYHGITYMWNLKYNTSELIYKI